MNSTFTSGREVGGSLTALFAQHVSVWAERVGGCLSWVLPVSVHTARLRLRRKSGRYLSRCRRWKRRRHSTFPSGKKSGRCVADEIDRTQHVYVWEEEWTVIYWDVVAGKRRRHNTFTSGKKSGRFFIEMTSMVILRFSSMSSHRRKVQTTFRPTSSHTTTSSQYGGVMNMELIHELVWQQVEIDRLCRCIWVSYMSWTHLGLESEHIVLSCHGGSGMKTGGAHIFNLL